MDEYTDGTSLYLLEAAKDVVDVRNEEYDEAVVLEYDVSRERSLGAVVLEYDVSRERSLGAGMLFPRKKRWSLVVMDGSWLWSWLCLLRDEDQSTLDAQELRPRFGLFCMVANAATAAGVGFRLRRRPLPLSRRFGVLEKLAVNLE